MKKIKIVTAILLGLIVLSSPALALKKTGQAGFKFLDVGMGAAPAGMGEAYTVLGSGVNALFYNPAGLAKLDSKMEVTFSRTQWIADISYNAAAMVINAGNYGNFALSFLSPAYPDIEGTMVADNAQGYTETGNVEVGAYAFSLSYGRRLSDKFMIGGNLKYASQNLGVSTYAEDEEHDNKLSTMVADFGTVFYPRFGNLESFAFGMSVRNFSPQIKYEESEFLTPLTFTIGFAVDVFDIMGEEKEDMALNLEVDALHPRDYTERVHVGGEFLYKNMVALRSGYKFNYDEAGFTFGFGLRKGFIMLDYAYTSFGVFDSVSRFSLNVAL